MQHTLSELVHETSSGDHKLLDNFNFESLELVVLIKLSYIACCTINYLVHYSAQHTYRTSRNQIPPLALVIEGTWFLAALGLATLLII